MIVFKYQYPGDPQQEVALMSAVDFVALSGGMPKIGFVSVEEKDGQTYIEHEEHTLKIVLCDCCGDDLGLFHPLYFVKQLKRAYCLKCAEQYILPYTEVGAPYGSTLRHFLACPWASRELSIS